MTPRKSEPRHRWPALRSGPCVRATLGLPLLAVFSTLILMQFIIAICSRPSSAHPLCCTLCRRCSAAAGGPAKPLIRRRSFAATPPALLCTAMRRRLCHVPCACPPSSQLSSVLSCSRQHPRLHGLGQSGCSGARKAPARPPLPTTPPCCAAGPAHASSSSVHADPPIIPWGRAALLTHAGQQEMHACSGTRMH